MRARVCPENRQLFCSIFFGTRLLRDTNSNMVNFVFQHGRLWPLRTFVVSPWLVTDVIVTLVYAKVRYCGWCNHCIRILLQWPLHENSDAETTGWFNAALLPTLPPPHPGSSFLYNFPQNCHLVARVLPFSIYSLVVSYTRYPRRRKHTEQTAQFLTRSVSNSSSMAPTTSCSCRTSSSFPKCLKQRLNSVHPCGKRAIRALDYKLPRIAYLHTWD